MTAPSPVRKTTILKGQGRIDPVWAGQCLHLFKEEGVNIRRLFLMQDADPAYFTTLEIQFAPDAQQTGFLSKLEAHAHKLEDAKLLLSPVDSQ